MVATAGGLDERLLRACSAFLAVGRGSPNGRDPMTLPDFLAARCRQLLGCYPTSAAEDEALLRRLQEEGSSGIGGGAEQAAAAQAGVRRQQLQTAVRYRLGKKRVLQATLAAVTGGQG